MNKSRLRLLAVVLAGAFTYTIYQYDAAQTSDRISSPIIIVPKQDSFDQRHAEDMANKAEKGSQLVGEVSPTIDLLLPADEQDIVTEWVEYSPGVQGFLAYPQDTPDAPGVVVIHEWRGLNEHIEDMARVLAMHGYRALAVDLYQGNIAQTADEAMQYMGGVDQTVATANLLAAEEYLRQDAPKVASLGRCMGGKQSLELSLASDTLDATVIYYGRLTDDADLLATINQPLLGIFAENDTGIPPSAVADFEQALDTAGKTNYDITIYPGVDHAFANPTGGNYEKEATLDAWAKTLNFLEDVFIEQSNEGEENAQIDRATYTNEEVGFMVDYPIMIDGQDIMLQVLPFQGGTIIGDIGQRGKTAVGGVSIQYPTNEDDTVVGLSFYTYAYETEADIQRIVKEYYNSEHCLWMDPPFVFADGGAKRNVIDERLLEDEEGDFYREKDACRINYMTFFNVYPDQKKIMAVDIGQACNIAIGSEDTGYMNCYDNDIIESFRWSTDTQ